VTTWDLYCAVHLAGPLTVLGPACSQAECAEPAVSLVHWPSGPIRCCERHATRWREVATAMGVHVVVEELPVWAPPERDDFEQRCALLEMA
jgi:hypothetical protein